MKSYKDLVKTLKISIANWSVIYLKWLSFFILKNIGFIKFKFANISRDFCISRND
jgi:hypothetical protein